MRLLVLSLFLFPVYSFSQVGVRVDAGVKEDTTIEVKKGVTGAARFEITEGSVDVDGDASPLLQEARKNWKTACADWKAELKELNKSNQIIVMNCGSMSCSTVAMESTCKSKATYKIKVPVS